MLIRTHPCQYVQQIDMDSGLFNISIICEDLWCV